MPGRGREGRGAHSRGGGRRRRLAPPPLARLPTAAPAPSSPTPPLFPERTPGLHLAYPAGPISSLWDTPTFSTVLGPKDLGIWRCLTRKGEARVWCCGQQPFLQSASPSPSAFSCGGRSVRKLKSRLHKVSPAFHLTAVGPKSCTLLIRMLK